MTSIVPALLECAEGEGESSAGGEPGATLPIQSEHCCAAFEAAGGGEVARRVRDYWSDGVREIYLSRLGLHRLPEELGEMAELTSVEVGNNRLKSLPDSIGKLHSLLWLSAFNNRLQLLPESIGTLRSLRMLFLRDNRIDFLPASIGLLGRLEYLQLNRNQLTSLPRSVGKLTKLQFLELADNRLTSVPIEIGKLRALKRLNLQNNRLIRLPRSLLSLSSSCVVDVRGNPLREGVLAAFRAAIAARGEGPRLITKPAVPATDRVSPMLEDVFRRVDGVRRRH